MNNVFECLVKGNYGQRRVFSPQYHAPRKTAFTLAEVLITLGIIGVVAALTLPMLIADYRKKEIPVRLKKFYSTLENALTLSSLKNGPINYWDFPNKQSDYEQINNFFKTYLRPYIIGIKECDNTFDSKSCNKIRNNFTEQKGTEGYVPIYIMPDGSCFKLTTGGAGDWGTNLHFFYDYNCMGHPNMLDKDIFEFFFTYHKAENKVRLRVGGYQADNAQNRDDLLQLCKQRIGSCGALIQNDGWEIKDDYPWL